MPAWAAAGVLGGKAEGDEALRWTFGRPSDASRRPDEKNRAAAAT